MRKILLAMTLLSVAISENILMEKHPRPMMWIREKQFSSKRPKRASRDDILSELEDVPNYDDDDRQFSRISNSRFINEPVQLPPVAVIRQPNSMRFSQVSLLPADKSKLDNAKPTVMISIGIQDKSATGDSQDECSTRKNYRKHNHDWQMQQPFYVDEPHWIDIEADYTDGSTRHPEDRDPYIMSRGKKFRIKSPNKLQKTIEDYEEFLDYASRSKKLSTKNRVRRSVETNLEELQDEVEERRNQKEKMRRYNLLRDLDGVRTNKITSIQTESPDERSGEESDERKKKTLIVTPVRDTFNDEFETDKFRNLKESPYDRKFAKWNRTTANNTLITNSVEEERKIQHEEVPSYIGSGDDEIVKIGKRFHSHKNHFAIGTKKGRERVVENGIFVRKYGKRGNHEIGWINADYEDNIDRKKIATFERTRLRDGYLNKIENFSTYDDLFIPSRGKKPLGDSEDSKKKGTRPNKSSAGQWEDSSSVQRYTYREEPGSEEREAKEDMSEYNKDDTGSADARLTAKPDSKNSSGMRSRTNYREKRNIYEAGSDLQEDDLLRSIEQEIVESAEAYLKPRNKHGNLLDLENHLSTDPFFIMRGKKTSREPADAMNSVANRRNMNDVSRAMHPLRPTEENLLKMFLMKRPKCNEQYCDTNRSLMSESILRNRRDSLDKLLTKYDPFVIIRGKRVNLDKF